MQRGGRAVRRGSGGGVDEGGVVGSTSTLHEVPLSRNAAGTAPAPAPDQEPRKPPPTLAPVPREPFQLSLAAVTVVPDWDHSAFQPWVTFRPSARSKVRLPPSRGARLLVMFTAAWKPVDHWLVTEYSTVQAGVAPCAVTAGTTTLPRSATGDG